ncbi:MAG: hypothetical protein RLZZ26_235 [Candidatus Parcubacteria bacterium]|jgi:hypothetical protein
MRNSKVRIKLEAKKISIGQYGESEDGHVTGEFETIQNQHRKYARAIGSYLISFSQLEHSLDNDLATAVNERAHEPGYRILKYLSFRDKANFLKDDYAAYIKYCMQEPYKTRLLADVQTIHSKLCELSEFRNKVAHANWQSLDLSGFVRTKMLERKDDVGMEFEKIKMTPIVLSKFRRQNEALASRLEYFREKVWEANRREIAKLHRNR